MLLLVLNVRPKQLAKLTTLTSGLNQVFETRMMPSQTFVIPFFVDSWTNPLTLVTQHCGHDLQVQAESTTWIYSTIRTLPVVYPG